MWSVDVCILRNRSVSNSRQSINACIIYVALLGWIYRAILYFLSNLGLVRSQKHFAGLQRQCPKLVLGLIKMGEKINIRTWMYFVLYIRSFEVLCLSNEC